MKKPSVKVFLDLDALRKSLKIYPKILFANELLNLTLINDKECHEFEKAAEFKIPITHGQVRPVFRFYCDENNEITIKTNGFEQTIEGKEKKWIETRSDMLDSLKHSQWLISSSGDSGCGLYEQGPCGNALMVKAEVLTENAGYAISFCPNSIVYYK